MGIRSYGVMGVDWEERIDFDRLRKARLARAQAALEQSELGALDVPVPFSPPLEDETVPTPASVAAAARALCQNT